MLDLAFDVDGVEVERHAATPTLRFTLRITAQAGGPVHAIVLRTRIVIEARRRRYTTAEESRLTELYGERERWHDTLQAVQWADLSIAVPGFAEHTTVNLPVPCTYDMEVASTKYLHGVDAADVPVAFQFSGTAFVRGPAGFAVVQLPHDLEARWKMPAGTWKVLMDAYFPGSRWVRLRPETFEALRRYRAERALPSWDHTIDDLLVGLASERARAGGA